MTRNDTDTETMNESETEEQNCMTNPPYKAYFIIETNVITDAENTTHSEGTVHTDLFGPYESREKAENKLEMWQQAWQKAIENDKDNPYDVKDWKITEQHITEFKIEQLERQSEEEHKTTMRAGMALCKSTFTNRED